MDAVRVVGSECVHMSERASIYRQKAGYIYIRSASVYTQCIYIHTIHMSVYTVCNLFWANV